MVLITTRSDGRPNPSPETGGIDDSGRIVVTSYPERAKVRNVRRDPRVSVLVLSDDFGGAWVQVDGAADVVDAVVDVEPFVEYFRNISGEHPDWDEYRRAMVDQGKSLVRVTPTSGSRWRRWVPPAARRALTGTAGPAAASVGACCASV